MSAKQPQRFGNDPALRSHLFEKKKAARPVFGNQGELWRTLTIRVGCDECQAVADHPCISLSKTKAGAALPSFHAARFAEAKRVFGRKK